MANYDVRLHPRTERELSDLPDTDFKRIDHEIQVLGHTPRPIGVKKLGGDLYRIRIGDWRVIFAILDKEKRVVVLRVARRSEKTYRRFK